MGFDKCPSYTTNVRVNWYTASYTKYYFAKYKVSAYRPTSHFPRYQETTIGLLTSKLAWT